MVDYPKPLGILDDQMMNILIINIYSLYKFSSVGIGWDVGLAPFTLYVWACACVS